MIDSIDLGLVKVIHIGLTAPTNTAMLWYDDNTGVKFHKYYDVVLSEWIPLKDTSIIEIEWEVLYTLKYQSLLLPGVTYKITDRYNYQSGGSGIMPNQTFLGDDRGLVYIKALTTNTLSKEVVRIMACPSTYSTPLNGKVSIGIWNNSWKTISINQVAIWGGKVFKNLTGSIGTAINDTKLDTTNWVIQNKQSLPLNYTDKKFLSKYDFDNDWFEEQCDEKGNRFGVTFIKNTFVFNPIDISDWNCETSSINTIFRYNKNIGIWNNSNSDPAIGGNSLGSIYNNINNGYISNNFGFFVSIYNNNNQGNIISNYNYGTGVTSNINDNINNGHINNNKVNYGITKNSTNGNISNNELGVGIIECVNDETLADISSIIEADGGVYKNLLFNNFAATNPYKYYKLDISGQNDIYMLGTSVANTENSKLLLISTNATETINTLTFFPVTKKSKIYIKTGVVVTFVHGTGVDNPRCKGAISAVLDGSNGDWIEFEERDGVIFETDRGIYS